MRINFCNNFAWSTACMHTFNGHQLGCVHLRLHVQTKRFGWCVERHTCQLQLAAQVRTNHNSLSTCCFPHLSYALRYSYITPRRDVSDLQSQARGQVTVIRYIPTRRDVAGLYPISYYGLHHIAVRLLWSLNGNCFCVIVAHWYSLDRLSFAASSWAQFVWLPTAMLSTVENDNGKKVASCLHISRKRFGSIAPVGWSDSDSNYEKENDVKTINTKRLSLSL